MPTRPRAQLAIDETLVDDQTVESALEERQRAADEVSAARAVKKAADNRAMVAIERLELPVGAVARVGRFRIEHVETEARSVSFTTEKKDRIKIALAETSEAKDGD